YSGGVFTLTGGYIYALGCGASAPDPATSTQCALAAQFVPSLEAGSTVSVCVDDVQYLRETSPYAMNTVFWSAPEVYDGMPFTMFANDVLCGDGFVTAGIMTNVTADVP
ncbi:MAG: hypothetical protein K2I93_02810, partial [Oscillospiraceae bacterium]|nr:hypothetical protein [Oscillospiraceae bacterium]